MDHIKKTIRIWAQFYNSAFPLLDPANPYRPNEKVY